MGHLPRFAADQILDPDDSIAPPNRASIDSALMRSTTTGPATPVAEMKSTSPVPRIVTPSAGNQAMLRMSLHRQQASVGNQAMLRMQRTTLPPLHPAPPAIQRVCAQCDTCQTCDDETPTIQAKLAPGAAPALDTAAAVQETERAGQPLPTAVRADLEARLGHDFGEVRVHADGAAASAARSVRARAYTLGSHVVFGAGQYAPDRAEGRHLLAHELAHVVQQQGAPVTAAKRDGIAVAPAGDRLEREADLFADAATAPASSGPMPLSPVVPVLQRDAHDGDALADPADPTWHAMPVGAGTPQQLAADGARILAQSREGSPLRRALIFVLTGQLQIFSSNGQQQLGVFPLREGASPLPPGVYLSSTERTVVLGSEGARRSIRDVTVGDGGDPAEMDVSRWAVIDAAQLRPLFGSGPLVGLVIIQGADMREPAPGAVPPPPPAAGAAPPPAPTARPRRTAPGGTLPVWRSGSEFEGGRRDANATALPASISGPDIEAVGATGTYRMELDYSVAGSDTLSQVVERMNWVTYRWERFDITSMVLAGLAATASAQHRHAAVSSDASVSPLAASRVRARRAISDLQEETTNAASDLRHPIASARRGGATAVVRNAIANYESIALLPASALVALGSTALGTFADLVGGSFQERELPMPNEGYFLIRCLAQPDSQGSQRRAASVATKIVEVRPTARLATGALDEPEAQIAETRLALALERDPARRVELERQLADQRRSATGTSIDAIDVAIEARTRDLAAASSSAQDGIQRDLSALREQRALAVSRGGAMSGTVYRPRAALVSEVTGQTYPLLLQLGALPREGETYAYALSDVTSRDGRPYEGRGSTVDEAVDNAFADLAAHNEYGAGVIAVRLPAGEVFRARELMVRSFPRDIAVVRRRLEDLAAVLMAAALFIPGVGEAAAILGAAIAADRLIERWRNGTLRADAAAITDIIGVIGGIAAGASVIGRLRVLRVGDRFLAAAREVDEVGMAVAARELRSATAMLEGTAAANRLIGLGGVLWGNLTTLDAIATLDGQERAGTISHAEARRQRASLIFGAIQNNAMLFAPHPGERAAEPAAPEGTPRGREPGIAAEPGVREPSTEPRRVVRAEPGAGVVEAEQHQRARATTPDGLHEITVLDDGRLIRCSRNCGEVRAHYGTFLAEIPSGTTERRPAAAALEPALTALEARSTAAAAAERSARTAGDEAALGRAHVEQAAIATETAALESRMRDLAAAALGAEMGVDPHALRAAVDVLPPSRLRELSTALGPELFRLLAASHAETMQAVSDALATADAGADRRTRALDVMADETARRLGVPAASIRELVAHLTPGEIAQLQTKLPERDLAALSNLVRTDPAELARVRDALGIPDPNNVVRNSVRDLLRRNQAGTVNVDVFGQAVDIIARMARTFPAEIVGSMDQAGVRTQGTAEQELTRARTRPNPQRIIPDLLAFERRLAQQAVEVGGRIYRPDFDVMNGERHSPTWPEAEARQRAADEGNPQGRFRNFSEVRWAVEQAAALPPGVTEAVIGGSGPGALPGAVPAGFGDVFPVGGGPPVRANSLYILVRANGEVHTYPGVNLFVQ